MPCTAYHCHKDQGYVICQGTGNILMQSLKLGDLVTALYESIIIILGAKAIVVSEISRSVAMTDSTESQDKMKHAECVPIMIAKVEEKDHLEEEDTSSSPVQKDLSSLFSSYKRSASNR